MAMKIAQVRIARGMIVFREGFEISEEGKGFSSLLSVYPKCVSKGLLPFG